MGGKGFESGALLLPLFYQIIRKSVCVDVQF